MYEGLTVAAVVPAYNEERLIATTIGTMPPLVDHIIVVDDASADATTEQALAVGDPRVELVRHDRNTGVGGSILDGHRRVLELGADVSVVMAGDAQMDPQYLPALLDPIVHEGVEFTKANRFFSRVSYQGMPRLRVLGNVALSFLTKAASGYWHLFDPQNGYTATTREALGRVDLDAVETGYAFENDWLIRLAMAGVVARDVPIPARYGEEVSGMRLGRVAPHILATLFRGFWRRMIFKNVVQSFSPVALLFFTGLLLIAVGSLFGIFAIVESIGPPSASAGTVLLAVAPWLAGIQLLLNAMLLDIQESPDRPIRAWSSPVAPHAQRAAQHAAPHRPADTAPPPAAAGPGGPAQPARDPRAAPPG